MHSSFADGISLVSKNGLVVSVLVLVLVLVSVLVLLLLLVLT